MKTILTLRFFFLFLILGACNNTFAFGSNDNACPFAVISYSGSPYCSNAGQAAVSIKGTLGGTFFSDPGLSINMWTGVVDLSTSTPGTYTVTYAVSGTDQCGDFTTTTSITITAVPSATIAYSGSPYCLGSGTASVSLTGTTGGTFSSDAQVIIDPNTGIIDLANSTPGNHTVSYVIIGSNGCGDFVVTTPVTINATPFATISYNNSNYCSNAANAQVNLTGDAGGVFSSSPGLTIDPVTGEINFQSSTPGTYQVNYDLSNNCGVYTASFTVNINPTPVAGISYDNAPYCNGNGGNASVTFTGTPGGTFSSTSGLVIDGVSGTIDLGSSTPGTYTVSYFVSTGNCSATANTTVTISSPPNASISYSPSSFCIPPGSVTGSVAYVTLSGTTGGIFSAGDGLAINSISGNIDLNASLPGEYTVTYFIGASAGNCGDFTTTTGITLIANPNATIWYQNSPYCTLGDTAMVSMVGTEGGTFTSTAGLVIDAASGTIDIQSSTPGDYVVSYTVGGTPCGPFTTSANITLDASCVAHPIVFNDIRTTRQHNSISVNWLVSNQKNISNYVIERSADGLNFSVVGNQTGNGKAGIGVAYSWTDINPGTGDNYYRIRSTSNKGATVVSFIIKARNNNDGSLVNIFPNPVVGHAINIQLNGMEDGTYGLRLINDNGEQVQFNQIVFKGGNAVHNIKLGSTITKGYYHMEIVHPDGTRTTEPVVIIE